MKDNINLVNSGSTERQYNEAVSYIDAAGQFLPGTGVSRAEKMLELLGHPESRLKIIHVAGSNGKGSVCAYLERILRENGYTTGMFISPHLEDERERIQVNGEPVCMEDFVRAFSEIRAVQDRLGKDSLAYFDFYFGMALLIFLRREVDFCIIETGLGGRLDATNAVRNPLLTVIATISLEHTAVLGDTIEKIAGEKAGIIKPGVPVVFLKRDDESFGVISRVAENNGSEAFGVSQEDYAVIKNCGKRIDFSLSNGYYKNDCFSINTGAVYQVQNCALALTAAAVMEKHGYIRLSEEPVHAAVSAVCWQGRMEEILPFVYVDGAHNPEGIDALIKSVPSIAGNRRRILMFSAVNDKDYDKMIKRLCECGEFDEFVVTQIEGRRKLCDTQIYKVFDKYTGQPVTDYKDVCKAFDGACELRRKSGGVLFCTGSLYMVGEIKKYAENRLYLSGLFSVCGEGGV